MIATCVGTELKELNAGAQALKVQDAYRASESIAMKRYIEKQQFPQCQIDTAAITAHFGQSWSAGIEEFREAMDGSEFELERKIGEPKGDDLAAYLLDKKDIETVPIQLRERLFDISPFSINHPYLCAFSELFRGPSINSEHSQLKRASLVSCISLILCTPIQFFPAVYSFIRGLYNQIKLCFQMSHVVDHSNGLARK
jgi:hypothetical protein